MPTPRARLAPATVRPQNATRTGAVSPRPAKAAGDVAGSPSTSGASGIAGGFGRAAPAPLASAASVSAHAGLCRRPGGWTEAGTARRISIGTLAMRRGLGWGGRPGLGGGRPRSNAPSPASSGGRRSRTLRHRDRRDRVGLARRLRLLRGRRPGLSHGRPWPGAGRRRCSGRHGGRRGQFLVREDRRGLARHGGRRIGSGKRLEVGGNQQRDVAPDLERRENQPRRQQRDGEEPKPIRRARPGRACGSGPACASDRVSGSIRVRAGARPMRSAPSLRAKARDRRRRAESQASRPRPRKRRARLPASVAAFRLASARARRSRASASRSASAAGSNGSTAIGAPVVEPPRLSGVEPLSAATASLVALDTPPLNSRPPQNASPGYAFVLQKVPPGRQQAGGSEPVVAHDGAVVAR